jgi:hypothetical protein
MSDVSLFVDVILSFNETVSTVLMDDDLHSEAREIFSIWNCREPFGILPTSRPVTEDGPSPQSSWSHHHHVGSIVVLAGRATHVP